jgi:hypothetical protein
VLFAFGIFGNLLTTGFFLTFSRFVFVCFIGVLQHDDAPLSLDGRLFAFGIFGNLLTTGFFLTFSRFVFVGLIGVLDHVVPLFVLLVV